MMAAHPLAGDLEHILEHTRDLWDEVRGKQIFITGGTGFFGCWLLESFTWINERLNLGAAATVLTRDPAAFERKAAHLSRHPAVSLLRGDVRSFEYPSGEFPYVIHAATEASAKLNSADPLLMMETILGGMRHTLEFARTHGTRKFLFTSSGAVYGQQPADLTHIPEEYAGAPNPLDPGAAYGESKRAAELLGCIYSRQFGIEMKIARCFAFVGPYLPMDAHFAIGNFIRDGIKGGPIRVNGDGTPYRSYLYAADLAIWLWTLLIKAPSCRPYNVGSDADMTIGALAQTVHQEMSLGGEVMVAQTPHPHQAASRYVPSVERARIELGLTQSINLPEAIRKTLQWTKNQS